ncbi:hypothetical protein GBAR_LOCUS23575 [Geodia barretti]|nr:hypothetical protein GBAR_LOCUS23575 [Geodia barretti]
MRVKEDKSREKSGIGGLCIDGNKIYYSCCEKYTNKPDELYTIHICKPDGELMILGGFKHIRGIAKYGKNFYVVDSLNRRVLKFDSKWNPVSRTSRRSTKNGLVLSEPYGIYINGEYVFVCARRSKKICIFDHELNLRYSIKHHHLESGPIDITFFDGKFFVTIKSAIIVLEIDFERKTYKICKKSGILMDNKPEPFNAGLELRGIAASDKYLYVTETGGRLLCLWYHPTNYQLVYTDSIPQCSPVVVVYDAGCVYYSRRKNKKGRFAISRVVHDSSMNKMTYEDIPNLGL